VRGDLHSLCDIPKPQLAVAGPVDLRHSQGIALLVQNDVMKWGLLRSANVENLLHAADREDSNEASFTMPATAGNQKLAVAAQEQRKSKGKGGEGQGVTREPLQCLTAIGIDDERLVKKPEC